MRGSATLGSSLKVSQLSSSISHSRSHNESPDSLTRKPPTSESMKGSVGKFSSSGSIQKLNSNGISLSLKNQVEMRDFGKKNRREAIRRQSSSM